MVLICELSFWTVKISWEVAGVKSFEMRDVRGGVIISARRRTGDHRIEIIDHVIKTEDYFCFWNLRRQALLRCASHKLQM